MFIYLFIHGHYLVFFLISLVFNLVLKDSIINIVYE